MSEENKNEHHEPGPLQPQQVRYVPVEYLDHLTSEEDEIDLLELLKKIWKGRFTILKITVLFILFGVFWALASPEEFESESILMPEVQVPEQGSGAGRLLQQFGGAFGIRGGGGTPTGMIPPQIYPRIVNSLSFQLELLDQEIHFRDYDVTTTWPDFLENHYRTPLTTSVSKYTIGLPFTLLNGVRSLFGDDPGEFIVQEDPLEARFITITREQEELVEELRTRISVSQDQETGLLTTRVKLQDARASAELNRFLIERLKEYITDYRIEKAVQNLEFSEDQKQKAKTRFEESQIALADFQDRNVSLATARAQTELERLQDEKTLAFNVYNSLAQQVEEQRLAVQEQTPIFKEVQPVNVPTQRSEPRRALLVVIFTMLGGILSIGWVLIGPVIESLKSALTEEG